MSVTVNLGDVLPVTWTLPIDASGLFPEAVIKDLSLATVATLALSEDGATSVYNNFTFTPTASGILIANFITYSDAGRTIEDQRFERADQIYNVNEIRGQAGRNQVFEVLTRQPSAPFKPLTTRVRIYNTLANANTDNGVTGLIQVYTAVSTYDGNDDLIKHIYVEVGS